MQTEIYSDLSENILYIGKIEKEITKRENKFDK